jgi:hypothetical protein
VPGATAGADSLTVTLMMGGTSIYTSPRIPVMVTHVPTALESGDTLFYSERSHDTNDVPSSTAQLHKWIVLQTGGNAYGRDNVTQIQESIYDATGVVVVSMDTLYFSAASDGSIYQYNVLHILLSRIDNGSAFVGDVPEQWVKICDTKAPAGTTWSGISPDSIVISSVTLPGAPFPVDITFHMTGKSAGSHTESTLAGDFMVYHADHSLKVKITVSGLSTIQLMDDSIAASTDYSEVIGLVRTYLEGRNLTVKLGTQTAEQAVLGFDMPIVDVRRRK